MIRLIFVLGVVWLIMNGIFTIIAATLRHRNYNYCSGHWDNAIEDAHDGKFHAEEECKKWADRCHEIQEHSNSFTCIGKIKAIIWHLEFYNKIMEW